MGYFLYGGLSFGMTEFLKRRFVELAGPGLAALYPIPILLGARYVLKNVFYICVYTPEYISVDFSYRDVGF